MMKIILASGMILGATTFAMADSDKLPANAMTTAQITAQLQTQGFKISKVETDDGQYKVKAVDATGHKQKLKVNPVTGAVLSKDADD